MLSMSDTYKHQGVLGDAHLLALMYGGEMSFWAWRALSPDHPQRAKYASHGAALLSAYSHIVLNTPMLALSGWDTSRAAELLASLSP